MFRLLTLNNIAQKGLTEFNEKRYHISTDEPSPDAILVRSADLHDVTIQDNLVAIGRAGAGTNNIPIDRCTDHGIPVFNTPGANANAVKELVIAGLLLTSRHLFKAHDFVKQIPSTLNDYHQHVESQKKQFAGTELPGKTLGVIGLGNIGLQVANAGVHLGMKVIGFDPAMTIRHAWQLSSDVVLAEALDEVLHAADFLTLHIPLNEHTKHLINSKRLAMLKDRVVVMNFAREGIVDNAALINAIASEKVRHYICDFPAPIFDGNEHVTCLPHLGASTSEAEENCAVMIANELQDYLEKGTIRNSVNFPNVKLSLKKAFRICISNRNIPNMVAQISTVLSQENINIIDMINKSRDNVAYTLIDIDTPLHDKALDALKAIDGVLKVRIIELNH